MRISFHFEARFTRFGKFVEVQFSRKSTELNKEIVLDTLFSSNVQVVLELQQVENLENLGFRGFPLPGTRCINWNCPKHVHTLEPRANHRQFRPPTLCRSCRARQSCYRLGFFSEEPENIFMMSLHSRFFDFRSHFLWFHDFRSSCGQRFSVFWRYSSKTLPTAGPS